MHLFLVAFIISGALFAILEQQSLLIYFFLTVAIYVVISIILPGAKNISNRKKIMVATWGQPTEGVIHVKIPCRTQKVQACIAKNNAQNPDNKLTLTHFTIKAAAHLVNQSSEINGKLVFGKFVPHKTIDISCLVDIQGGKDLAMILIQDAYNKSVKQIAKFIREKGSNIKSNKGDKQHKQRTKLADTLPPFVVSFFITLASFLTNRLGISIPALALKRHQFGAGCVTSLGSLNFQDATAPFTGFMDCVFFLSLNAVHEQPVIQNGQVVPGRVVNCNFAVDHRFIDGGRAKNFISTFRQIFQNPQLFIDSAGPQQKKNI